MNDMEVIKKGKMNEVKVIYTNHPAENILKLANTLCTSPSDYFLRTENFGSHCSSPFPRIVALNAHALQQPPRQPSLKPSLLYWVEKPLSSFHNLGAR